MEVFNVHCGNNGIMFVIMLILEIHLSLETESCWEIGGYALSRTRDHDIDNFLQ